MPIIEVRGLSKQYRLGATVSYDTLRDAIVHGVKSIFRRGSDSPRHSEDESIWALKDISFDVDEGEILGIIGRNGAGKSTLLKVLSRITEPTGGTVSIKGRVRSLLEVGTGFHPELTGRENVYLNGAILGMKKEEIKRKFDEIVAFSGVEKFLDTPVKRYSSGMRVRLAFAVAAHLEPEILIVDEVLAVGDVSFQKKCLGRMGDVAKGGRTVLFVSHNMAAVNTLCSRAIVLDGGSVVYEGDTESAVRNYLRGFTDDTETSVKIDFEEDASLPIQIKRIALRDEEGNISQAHDYQKTFCFEVGIKLRKEDKNYYVAILIYDVYGNLVVFTADDDLVESELSGMGPGECTYKVRFPSRLLKPGEYFAKVNLNRRTRGNSELFSTTTLFFEVHDNISRRGVKGTYRPSIVAPEIPWEVAG